MKLSFLLLILIICIVLFSCSKKTLSVNDTKATLTSPAHTVVFLGNSITEGWSNHHPEFFENKAYINKGISGQTTDEMLGRFQQDVIDLKPNAVVILAGTNDIVQNNGYVPLDTIASNIFRMAELAKQNDIKVILCAITPAYDYRWKPGLNPNIKIPKVNAMIKKYAQENNIPFVDYFTAMANLKNGLIEAYGYDGVHPNKAGYLVMEPLVENAINDLFNK